MPAPYQRETYDGRASTQRMSDLLARRGAIQADLYLRQGDAAANTAQAVGSGVSQFMSDLLRYKADEPRRKLLEQETEARKADLADKEAARKAKTPIAQLLLDPSVKTTGQFNIPQYDYAKLEAATKANPDLAQLWPAIEEQARKRDALELEKFKTTEALNGLKRRRIAMAAYETLASGLDDDVLSTKVEELVSTGTVTREEAAGLLSKASSPDGPGMQGLVQQLIMLDPSVLPKAEYQKLSEGESLVRTTPGGPPQVVVRGRPKPQGFNLGDTSARFEIDPDTGQAVEKARGPLYGKARPKAPGSDDAAGVPSTALQAAGGGDAVLEGLPDGEKAIIKKIANYEFPLPGAFALRSKEWVERLKRVMEYDPSFDATQYQAKQSIKRSFTSGKAADNIRSLNTAIGHLAHLDAAIDKHGNWGSRTANRVGNAFAEETGSETLQGLRGSLTAVVDELATLFKGTSGTDEQIKAWKASFDENAPKDAQKAAVRNAVELAFSRLKALESQYETGTGKPRDFRIINAESVKNLQRLGVDVSQWEPGIGNQDAQHYTAPPSTPPQTNAIAGPITVTAPNGKTYTFASQEDAQAFKRAAGIP